MIVYKKLWATMKAQGVTYYQLEKHYCFSTSTLRRLQNNSPVNTETLNRLCYILGCDLSDIAEFIQDDNEKLELLKDIN